MTTKNQIAWGRIDEQLNILDIIEKEHGIFITSENIKKIGKREPRLMAKFDHRNNLPTLFKENKLGILPVSGYEYFISRFNMFENTTQDENLSIIDKSNLTKFETIDINNIKSEDKSLLIAKISNVFEKFSGENDLEITNKGKFGTGLLDFIIETEFGQKQIKVNSAGADLDIGLEGNCFYVIEAKIGKVSDFNIRQLFYPYLYWSKRIKKKVIPIFFTYSDKTFNVYQYSFKNPNNFNSIVFVKSMKFAFNEDLKLTDNLLNIKRFYQSDPPNIPFPQADDFEKVIDMVDLVSSGINKKVQFADYFDFTSRQSDYYFNAAKYLDLLSIKNNNILLTKKGNEIVSLQRVNRQAQLIKEILSRKVFYDTYMKIRENVQLQEEDIIEIMKKNNMLKNSTYNMLQRRARTIVSWCKWIMEKFDENGE